MSSFKGSDIYVIDSKGRVSIPAKMRKNIQSESGYVFVVTRGIEKCLYAYPMNEWRRLEESIRLLSQTNEKDRFFARTLLQWSEEVQLDAQFRLLIPKSLLNFAEITKEVFFIGVLDHIELWKPENFKKYIESRKESYEKAVEHVISTRKS